MGMCASPSAVERTEPKDLGRVEYEGYEAPDPTMSLNESRPMSYDARRKARLTHERSMSQSGGGGGPSPMSGSRSMASPYSGSRSMSVAAGSGTGYAPAHPAAHGHPHHHGHQQVVYAAPPRPVAYASAPVGPQIVYVQHQQPQPVMLAHQPPCTCQQRQRCPYHG